MLAMAKSPYPWLDDVLNLMARRSPPESGIEPAKNRFAQAGGGKGTFQQQTWLGG